MTLDREVVVDQSGTLQFLGARTETLMRVRDGEVEPESFSATQVGGALFARTVPGCKTCNHPRRYTIESSFVVGQSPRLILELVGVTEDEDGNKSLSARSIRNHMDRGHSSYSQAVQAKVITQHAHERGVDLEAVAGVVVDGALILKALAQRGFEKLQSGEIEISDVKDLISVANSLNALGWYEGSEVSDQVYALAFRAYMKHADRVMTDDQMRQFGDLVAQDPIMQALMATTRPEAQPSPDQEAILAEAVAELEAGTPDEGPA